MFLRGTRAGLKYHLIFGGICRQSLVACALHSRTRRKEIHMKPMYIPRKDQLPYDDMAIDRIMEEVSSYEASYYEEEATGFDCQSLLSSDGVLHCSLCR